MSDQELEAITPRMVTLKEIKSAVRLANAAPDLLAACKSAMDSIARVRCNSEKCGGTVAYNRAVLAEQAIRAAIRAAIDKAEDALTPAEKLKGAELAELHGA